jgi:ABC-type phosphate transport system substrate-binding protein
MMRKPFGILALLLASATLLSAQGGTGFRLIVNAAHPGTPLRRSEVSDIFLKKTTRWGHGVAVAPVDQSATSQIRAAFSKDVHGRSVDAVQNYWQQQIFSGRDAPPRVKTSDAEVMAFVQSNPGGIGYVSDTASLIDGVKLLTVTD